MANADKPTNSNSPDSGNSAEQWTETMNNLANNWQAAMGPWSTVWNDNIQTAMDATAEALKENDVKNPADLIKEVSSVKVNPSKIMSAQMELIQDYQKLWMHTTSRLLQPEVSPAEDGEKDHRFEDDAWTENPVFEFIKQSYMVNSKWLRTYLSSIEGLDDDAARKMEFYGQQIVDALAPTNFPLTNPTVIKETLDSKGENLVKGMSNLAEDLKNVSGGFRPRHTSVDDFEVGKDLATTPGNVIYQTPFMQLIQYMPTTKDVYKKPLLIVPPWINKFYILDLRQENSFIKWSVDQGYTVFVVSWVNPDETYADKSFDDYVKGGILAALEAIELATGEKQVNAIGYCIGGTLMAATLAYMAQHNDDRITSVTYFATQVDFEDAGDLRIFADETQITALEHEVKENGYLEAGSMAATFNMLRANDLIWFFHINNYLMGKEPPKFDLLYWNADATRFPATLLLDYLRSMYVENKLATPGAFKLLGEQVDLGKIKIPVYLQATLEDHIAPVESVFKATKLYGGPVRFVLGGSGHIAGVINPPGKSKYQYWTNRKCQKYDTAADWQADAKEHPGSWWPDWDKWLSAKSGSKVPARKIGVRKLKALEPAPGSYVLVRS